MTKVAPSLLSANPARLGAAVRALTKAGADWIHWDIMDGHFVPNLTFGPYVIKAVRPLTDLPFDTHLMLSHPMRFIEPFAQAGSDLITVHIEAEDDPADMISLIKKCGCRAGLSLRPQTKISRLIPFLPMIDLVLIMSVDPGFGGQPFQKEAIARITELKDLIGKKPVQISVDGGITDITAPACRLAGADILVAGNYIFKTRDYHTAIERLKK